MPPNSPFPVPRPHPPASAAPIPASVRAPVQTRRRSPRTWPAAETPHRPSRLRATAQIFHRSPARRRDSAAKDPPPPPPAFLPAALAIPHQARRAIPAAVPLVTLLRIGLPGCSPVGLCFSSRGILSPGCPHALFPAGRDPRALFPPALLACAVSRRALPSATRSAMDLALRGEGDIGDQRPQRLCRVLPML